MGSTGSSTGSHLHFEVHDSEGRPLNPQLFMGHTFAAARDLPLKQAMRLPRGLRVAFVSFIPFARQAQLLAREQQQAAPLQEGQRIRPDILARTEALARADIRPAAQPIAAAGVHLLPSAIPGRVAAQIDPGG